MTSYPSILGGRVKTLHPKIFGGILNRQDHEGDVQQMEEYQIPQIDLVIVDLYPFEKTVASGASEADIIEKIDIGGISLIRAAAKNFKDTVIVASVDQYADFLEVITKQNGALTLEDRKLFATKAFHVSSHYDTAIFNYFNIVLSNFWISIILIISIMIFIINIIYIDSTLFQTTFLSYIIIVIIFIVA